MVVDFALERSPAFRVASLAYTGPWRENHLQREFTELVAWAREHRIKTGKWVFVARGERRHEACLEVKGKARGQGRIRIRTLPATRVATVTFNPEELSPRVVYHGLNDWLKWRRKEGKIRRVVSTREVYSGDPWKNPAAWKRATVQYVVAG
jgi:DNA gyrase inhibitor GyrI